MRQRSSRIPAVCVFSVLLVLFASVTAEARNVGTGRGWRSTRYGRDGAEISVEIPRYATASGDAHLEERNVKPGLGFGFDLMWGISNNIAFEGRMLQSDHETGIKTEQWDINLLEVGPRFTFFTENRFQPFVGGGWAKMTFERDTKYSEGGKFERYTGYAWYASIGLDYIHSSAWSFFLRGDYVKGGYGYASLGYEGESVSPPLKSECASVSIGLTYRVPMW
jgi:hypothetical protein